MNRANEFMRPAPYSDYQRITHLQAETNQRDSNRNGGSGFAIEGGEVVVWQSGRANVRGVCERERNYEGRRERKSIEKIVTESIVCSSAIGKRKCF